MKDTAVSWPRTYSAKRVESELHYFLHMEVRCNMARANVLIVIRGALSLFPNAKYY